MKFDLHCHSYYSDGELSPLELVTLAEQAGVTHLALTDHDTLAGISEIGRAASGTSLNVINGLEFSCNWNGQLIHVLGLNVDPENGELQAGVEINTQSRLRRAEAMFVDFEKYGIELRDSVNAQIAERGVPTRPHFANALIESGKAKNKKQAFKRYLVPGKPGFVAMRWPDLEQVANWISAAGGVAVLAHPMRYKFTRAKLVRLIKDMLEVGIHGIEVSTPTTDRQQLTMLESLVRQHGLLASVGSDFHCHGQPWAVLGSAQPLAQGLTPVWTRF